MRILPLAILFVPALAAAAPPARLVPSEMNLMVGGDLAQLRAAGPPEVFKQLIEGARSAAEKIGADPEKLGQFVVGLLMPSEGSTGKVTAMLAADLPVDVKKLESQLDPPVSGHDYQGVQIRNSRNDSYAILPGDRIVLTEKLPTERIIDLSHGKGEALVDLKAAGLLKRVNASGGQGPALFAWIDLTQLKPGIRAQAKELGQLDEAAASLWLGGGGADLRVVGRCASAEAAQSAATASRAMIKEMAANAQMQIFGLKPMLDAIKVETESGLVLYTLHLTSAQYTDLLTRASGMISAMQAPPASPMPEEPQAPPQKTKGKGKKKKPTKPQE
jgi:hypothetical protein